MAEPPAAKSWSRCCATARVKCFATQATAASTFVGLPSLNRTIIPRAMLHLKPWATYNKVEHTFYFHNGSILELASSHYADSVTDQGAEYGVIAFE